MDKNLNEYLTDFLNLKTEVSAPQYLKILTEFFSKMKIDSINQINEQILFSYKKSISHFTDIKGVIRETKNSTINKKLVVTISFVKYLQRLKLLETSIEMPPLNSKDTPKRELLTLTQCKALLAVQNKSTYLGARDNIILQLFLVGSFRVSELLNIRWNSFFKRHSSHMISILGKGNKTRHIKINEDLFKQITQFKRKYFHDTDLNSYVFLSIPKVKNNFQPKKLSKTSVRFLLNKYSKLAGFPDNVRPSPHDLRAQSLSLSILGGASARSIQLQAGWANLSTSAHYIHSIDDMNNDAVDFNPLAKSKTQIFD